MSTSVAAQTILGDASVVFDTLASQHFGADHQPGFFSEYTFVKTGVTTLMTKASVLTNVAGMRKWVGPRITKRPRAYQQIITLDPYEATMEIPRTMVQYMDQQGQVTGLIKQFMDVSKFAYDEATHAAYVMTSGAGPVGYDGVTLFNASHPFGANGAVQSNLGALAFNAPNLDTTIAAMMSLRFENNRPMQVNPTHVRVGPKNANTAAALLNSGTRLVVVNASGVEASSSVVAATGVDNVYRGRLQPIVDQNLVGTMANWWEVLDLSKGDAKPMQLYVGRAPEPQHQDQMWNDCRFNLDVFKYGLEGEFKPDAGIWALAYRHVL